jgi:hypothetical protein
VESRAEKGTAVKWLERFEIKAFSFFLSKYFFHTAEDSLEKEQ